MKQKYKDLIRSIRNTIYKNKIDWDICESYVKKLSPVINEQLDDECILSDFMYDFSRGDRLLKFVRLFLENGFDVLGLDYSPIKGPEGNIEYLIYIRKSDNPKAVDGIDIKALAELSHSTLDKT